jgi:kumamolisin
MTDSTPPGGSGAEPPDRFGGRDDSDPPAPPGASRLVPLPGSQKPPEISLPAHARHISQTPMAITVVLRRRGNADQPPTSSPPITTAQLAERYGADPADVQLAASVLGAYGLTVQSVDAASRRLRVSGTVGAVERAFGTELEQAPAPGGGTYRQRSGSLSIPEPLAGIVTAVLGVDDTPQSRAHHLVASPHEVKASFTPVQLGEIYQFPPGTDGAGQTIAIIELGGGFGQSDLDTYFSGLGLVSPTVRAVEVDGAHNQPGGDPSGADGEVLLDIEVAGALAPKAEYVVYFAPNTDAGFLDAVAEAAHADPTPVAISISWGQYEEGWTAQSRTAMDDAFADAAALGIVVTAAAGDDGSDDRVGDGRPHTDFPASSPHVLGCGGTTLHVDAAGQVSAETVWGDGSSAGATGGGVSTVFDRPDWQRDLPVAGTGRGVPDVAAVADPATGYEVLVDGQRQVIGGTSAVAPLWAALAARIAQARSRPGGSWPAALYRAAGGLRDITSGRNGAYAAGPGWDACTGLGVPVGVGLLDAALDPPGDGAERPVP